MCLEKCFCGFTLNLAATDINSDHTLYSLVFCACHFPQASWLSYPQSSRQHLACKIADEQYSVNELYVVNGAWGALCSHQEDLQQKEEISHLNKLEEIKEVCKITQPVKTNLTPSWNGRPFCLKSYGRLNIYKLSEEKHSRASNIYQPLCSLKDVNNKCLLCEQLKLLYVYD